MSDKPFTSITSLGREGLIKHLSGKLRQKNKAVLQGIGDDAAEINQLSGNTGLISSESFTEGVDFDLTFTPLHHLGAKVVTAAVSDIYAMNGKPEAILVNLSLPNRISVEMIEELYHGIDLASGDYGCEVAGGDIGGSGGGLVISVTAYGSASPEKIVRRSGCRPDEAVCVSGDLGGALAGLNVLLREKKHWKESGELTMQPDLSEYEYVVKRQLVPLARHDVLNAFKEASVKPTSMIDLSQGLMNELQIMFHPDCPCGAIIYEAALPISLETRKVADEMQDDVDRYALYGGEDFELLFTLTKEDVEKLSNKFRDFAVIGKTTAMRGALEFQTAEGEIWKPAQQPADDSR